MLAGAPSMQEVRGFFVSRIINLYDFDRHVCVICLFAGESDRPTLLLKTNVSVVPLFECNRTLVEYNTLSNQPSLRALSDTQMCALNPNDNSDACQGDSGGPLFIAEPSGVSTIVGVISFGISCGSQLPGVYTRVASYKNWIESIIWP